VPYGKVLSLCRELGARERDAHGGKLHGSGTSMRFMWDSRIGEPRPLAMPSALALFCIESVGGVHNEKNVKFSQHEPFTEAGGDALKVII
jgi:hypothetical protein